MHYYIFNPEHDLALANHTASFVPPAPVRQMADELSLLPLWYAQSNSRIITSSSEAKSYLQHMLEIFPSFEEQNIGIISPQDFSADNHIETREFIPWGWDKSVREYFRKLSNGEELLPTDVYLEKVRWLSSRERAVEMLPKLILNRNFTGESHYFTDIASCQDFVNRHSQCILKAPLSGSGKGLLWYRDGIFTSPFERWCERQLSQQGGIVAEPIYQKYADMAVEFFIRNGKAAFAGYSFFDTTKTGVYTQNRLVPNTYLASTEYMPHIGQELLPVLQKEMTNLFGKCYEGYAGVDMMICTDPTQKTFVIHPCVEINARMTMGIVARLFYDRFVHPESSGTFHINYCKKEGETYRQHLQNLSNYPLQIENSQIRQGYLSLTPVNRQTHFQAWVEIHPS